MELTEPKQITFRQKRRRQRLVASLFIMVGLVLGVTALLLSARTSTTATEPPPEVQSQSAPSSEKPSTEAVNNYAVAPDLPKYINIPTIEVPKTRIIQRGLTKNNQIAEPDNIYDTGWYNGSTKPGQKGALFIYGHVSSWQANGVFYNLKKLKPGDKIYIVRGDNKQFVYQVVSLKTYNYKHVDMDQVLSPIDVAKPGLNLMTCTGRIIKGTSEFNERLVVFASLVSARSLTVQY